MIQKRSAKKKSLHADANVELSIEGLAFCYLKPKISKINFLSHVPFHKLRLIVKQIKRNSKEEAFLLDTFIDGGHTISIKTENAVTPKDITTDGNFPLKEIVNISNLHGRKINYKKNLPPKLTPITLSVEDCAFFTEQMTTSNFEIIESDDSSKDIIVRTKKIGYVMGGKIQCHNTSGNLTIEVKGSQPLKIKRPLKDAEGDFVYDISLSNHCLEIENCRKLMKDDSDFRFYYDVLEDSLKPNRKFKIKKASKSGDIVIQTADVAACNIIIVEPPPPPFPPE